MHKDDTTAGLDGRGVRGDRGQQGWQKPVGQRVARAGGELRPSAGDRLQSLCRANAARAPGPQMDQWEEAGGRDDSGNDGVGGREWRTQTATGTGASGRLCLKGHSHTLGAWPHADRPHSPLPMAPSAATSCHLPPSSPPTRTEPPYPYPYPPVKIIRSGTCPGLLWPQWTALPLCTSLT